MEYSRPPYTRNYKPRSRMYKLLHYVFRPWVRYTLEAILLFGAVFLFLLLYTTPPKDFPTTTIITIPQGAQLDAIAEDLERQRIIRSATTFRVYASLSGQDSKLVAGDYLFGKRVGVIQIVNRIADGEYGDTRIRVTLPEGGSVAGINRVLKAHFDDFDSERFLELAEPKEGYLFPDTYFFFPTVTPEEIVAALEAAFDREVAKFEQLIAESELSLHEIITLASILDREAAAGKLDEHRMIAGIMFKRMSIDMALQVDATFAYLLGKSSRQLTRADLNIDSPYNTYRYKGLPPGPIGNPGIIAIQAALTPIPSDYLFYLHDRNQGIHYAENFARHKENKRIYIDSQ